MALFHDKQLKTSFASALALVAAAFAISVFLGNAVQAQPAGGNGGPRPPSQEALAACKSLASGASCSFSSQQGSVTGTCWAPQGMALACKPKNAPMPGGRPASAPR